MTDYCGQRDVCAEAPGCGWHWGERVREVMAERDALIGAGCTPEQNALALLDLYHQREQDALAALREAEADVVELGATVAAAVAERDVARAELAAHARIVQAARAWHAARASADLSDVAEVALADAELMAAVEAER